MTQGRQKPDFYLSTTIKASNCEVFRRNHSTRFRPLFLDRLVLWRGPSVRRLLSSSQSIPFQNLISINSKFHTKPNIKPETQYKTQYKTQFNTKNPKFKIHYIIQYKTQPNPIQNPNTKPIPIPIIYKFLNSLR